MFAKISIRYSCTYAHLERSRQRAGMPLDEDGIPMKSYTNQSECINNVLTKQKESAVKNDKASICAKSGRRWHTSRRKTDDYGDMRTEQCL